MTTHIDALEEVAFSVRHWLRIKNIVFVGLLTNDDGAPYLEVRVENKKTLRELTGEFVVPRTLRYPVRSKDGSVTEIEIPTSVVESGPARLLAYDNYVRPVYGGFMISIQRSAFTASNDVGTLGVNMEWEGRYRMITNNHIISRNGGVGRTVYQARPGKEKYKFAKVSGFVHVTTTKDPEPKDPTWNKYDFAYCDVDPNIASPYIAIIGLPRGYRRPEPRENVEWVGYLTGRLQSTKIRTRSGILRVEFTRGNYAFFKNVMEFEGGEAQPGDSGSAIIGTKDKKVIGLLTAGDGKFVYALRIPPY